MHAWHKALGNRDMHRPGQLNASLNLVGADGLAMLLRALQLTAFLCSQFGDSKHSSDELFTYM